MPESNILSETHQYNKSWGSSSNIPSMAKKAIEGYDVKTLLDFGSGKGLVSNSIREKCNIEVISYDPSVNNRTDLPDKVDMVFSKDVLEHIEPEQLEYTLYDLHRKAQKISYHLIACHKAHHYLADGRNCHLIVETPDWWQSKLRSLGYKILDEHIWGEIKKPAGKESLAVVKYEVLIAGQQES